MISTTFATKTYKNFINNEWVNASSGNTIESINPADKEPVGYVQSSTEDDLNKAVASAHKAKRDWRRLGQSARGQILFKTANILEEI